MNYTTVLEEIAEEIKPLLGQGQVADYIPVLANVDPNQFAMTLTLFDGTQYSIGNVQTLFSIQSISKVFTIGVSF